MNTSDKRLADELDTLANQITTALARIHALATDPMHVIRRDSDDLDVVRATGPELCAALRSIAERLESSCCESVVIPNARLGIESVVRPAAHGYAVVLRDTDRDRTLPTIHRFSSREEAVARAKHLVGVA